MSINCNNLGNLSHGRNAGLQKDQEANRQANKGAFQRLGSFDQDTSRMPHHANLNRLEQEGKGRKVAPPHQLSLDLSKNYPKYHKGIKREGETPQERVKSKLNYILSGFHSDSEADSVSYYNRSARKRSSSSSSSSSIRSNERAPINLKSQPNHRQPVNDIEAKEGLQNQFLDVGSGDKKASSKKYLFYEQKNAAKGKEAHTGSHINQQDISKKKMQMQDKEQKKAKVIFQEITHKDQFQQEPFLNSKKANENQKASFQNTKGQKDIAAIQIAPVTVNIDKPQQKHTEKQLLTSKQRTKPQNFEEIQDMLGGTPQQQVPQPKVTRSVSISKDGSADQTPKPSRYSNAAKQSIRSKGSDSVEIYDPVALRSPKKQSIQSDRYFGSPQDITLNLKEAKHTSNKEKQSQIESLILVQRERQAGSKTNEAYLDDALEQFVKDSNKVHEKRGSQLQIVETHNKDRVEQTNEFLPTNKVNFKIESRRKMKTELSERSEDRSKVLGILKKREEALAKKVRQQLRITPKLYQKIQSSSGFSRDNSLPAAHKHEMSLPIKHNISLEHNYASLQYTDKIFYKDKNIGFRANQKPYYPTEDLKYAFRKPTDKPKTFSSEHESNDQHYLPITNQLQKQRPSRAGVIPGQQLSKDLSLREQKEYVPQKISYYNLNKFQREKNLMRMNQQLTAKDKYERLKRLIEQI